MKTVKNNQKHAAVVVADRYIAPLQSKNIPAAALQKWLDKGGKRLEAAGTITVGDAPAGLAVAAAPAPEPTPAPTPVAVQVDAQPGESTEPSGGIVMSQAFGNDGEANLDDELPPVPTLPPEGAAPGGEGAPATETEAKDEKKSETKGKDDKKGKK